MVYDCTVVGAVPAGGMAAWTISKEGYNVLLIDRRSEICLPIRCAEGVSHHTFDNSGISPSKEWIKKDVKAIMVPAPNGKPFYLAQGGYSIDRKRFHSWVANNALDRSCTLKLRTIAKEAFYDGILWEARTNSSWEKSRILIAADGGISRIAGFLGMLRKREWIKGF
ncbi:MAG: NAD(P)/FAD-dependent oxidoreductase [Thermoplasmata archaeon]